MEKMLNFIGTTSGIVVGVGTFVAFRLTSSDWRILIFLALGILIVHIPMSQRYGLANVLLYYTIPLVVLIAFVFLLLYTIYVR
jgi:hypothetical protein